MKGDHSEMPVNFSRPVRDWLRAVLWPGDRWNEWNRATKARSFLQLKCPQGKRWLSPNTSHYRTLSIIKWVSNSRCRLLLVVDNFPLVQHDLIAIPSLSQPANQHKVSQSGCLNRTTYLNESESNLEWAIAIVNLSSLPTATLCSGGERKGEEGMLWIKMIFNHWRDTPLTKSLA